MDKALRCVWMAVNDGRWRLLSNRILLLKLLIVSARLSKFHWWAIVHIKNALVDARTLRLLLLLITWADSRSWILLHVNGCSSILRSDTEWVGTSSAQLVISPITRLFLAGDWRFRNGIGVWGSYEIKFLFPFLIASRSENFCLTTAIVFLLFVCNVLQLGILQLLARSLISGRDTGKQ